LTAHLQQQIEAKAAEFVVAPEKGQAAGYTPEPRYRRSGEIGGSNELIKDRSDLAAWLYGIARRDLVAWDWHIEEAIGGAAFISIVSHRD
jgi:hypothetical protein